MAVVWKACTGGRRFQLHIYECQNRERQEEERRTPFSRTELLPPKTLERKFEVFARIDLGGYEVGQLIYRHGNAEKSKPTFPVSREIVLCLPLTVPQASVTAVWVGKLGAGAFLPRCLRTRVARSGLLAVPGDRRRLRRFCSKSSGSSPCCFCLEGLGIGAEDDGVPPAGGSGWVGGEVFWIEQWRALLSARALIVFDIGIGGATSVFVDLAASVCVALGGVGCDFLSLLDDAGDSGLAIDAACIGLATSISRLRSSIVGAAAGSCSFPRVLTSLPSRRVIVSAESNASSKSTSIRDALRSVLSLSSAKSPCRNDDGGRLGFLTPAPGRKSVPMVELTLSH